MVINGGVIEVVWFEIKFEIRMIDNSFENLDSFGNNFGVYLVISIYYWEGFELGEECVLILLLGRIVILKLCDVSYVLIFIFRVFMFCWLFY